jgi:hypothetical protein
MNFEPLHTIAAARNQRLHDRPAGDAVRQRFPHLNNPTEKVREIQTNGIHNLPPGHFPG